MKYGTNINLQNAGIVYYVTLPELIEAGVEDYKIDELCEFSGTCREDLEDGWAIPLTVLDLENFKLEGLSVLRQEWDEFTADDVIEKYVKPAWHYLVFAAGCRWNGASGYTFTDSLAGIAYRDHIADITPVRGSNGRKVLVCRESSHDVPMGSTTIVVALTRSEYERLKSADFAEVESFARAMADRAA